VVLVTDREDPAAPCDESLALLPGRDEDRPRNLAKSVTTE
jgi:hypothetical protein